RGPWSRRRTGRAARAPSSRGSVACARGGGKCPGRAWVAAVASRPMDPWIEIVGAVAVLIGCMVAGGRGWRRAPRGGLFTAFALLLVAAGVAVAWDAARSPGEVPEAAAALAAMIVGAAGGAVAAAILLVGSTERPSPRSVVREVATKLAVALALVVAFGFGSCWLGVGVASLARR